MKNFVRRIILFLGSALIFYIVFSLFIFPLILEKVYGPNIQKQLQLSFANAGKRDYKLLILGNSRLYCGINPDRFDVPAYNFSHNNDSYNQLYYKLMWVLKHNKKIENVILGVDHFQFSIFTDSRNYAYGKWLGDQYMKDYKPYHYIVTYYRETLNPYKLRALVNDPIYKHDIKSNGQFIRNGEPKENDFIKRNFNRLDIQISYFEKILAECKARNIKVFICLPPMRKAELDQYTSQQLGEFDQFIRRYVHEGVEYLDYSRDSRFSINDFIDFAHLNQRAADEFSEILNKEIKK
jgi:hypothetical protein